VTDAIIIGGGHNALTAAFYLARSGRRPLVIERRDSVGGGAVTAQIHPGCRCPLLSHEILLESQIVRDMDLERRGVEFLPVPTRACALAEGAPLAIYDDVARTVAGLKARSARDADSYLAFQEVLEKIAGVIGSTFDSPPPDIDSPDARDLWRLLQTGRRFRALGRRDSSRMLRWITMPVGDLLGEWFQDDTLKAMLAGPGVSGTRGGPRSAGTALVMLWREASRLRSGTRGLQVKGGPGALTQAMAGVAATAGAVIRTGVGVERILVKDNEVVGVVVNGEEIETRVVISGIDPRSTFLSLVDPGDLNPDFHTQVRNFRTNGTLAKVNLALSGLPTFPGMSDPHLLSGRVHVGPDLDYMERAFDHVKYGEVSEKPWLDITIPSIVDTELAPPGVHVVSIYVHYAPFRLRESDWNVARDVLLDRTLQVLEAHAPGVRSQVITADVISPARLEDEWGLDGGHGFHGELAPDQLFTMRPFLGCSRYESPIRGLFLCGAGSHPGGFMTGTGGRLAAQTLLRTSRHMDGTR